MPGTVDIASEHEIATFAAVPGTDMCDWVHGQPTEPRAIAGRLMSMDEHSLSFGANMLLWGFPLALAIFVMVSAIRERLRSEVEE